MLAELFGVDGIVVVVVIAILLLVGGSRIPKLARSLGSAKSEFEEGLKTKTPEGASSNGTSAATDAPAPAPAPAPPAEGTSQTS